MTRRISPRKKSLSSTKETESTSDVSGLVIRAPTTTADVGEPSKSLADDARRVFAFVDDERHLTANTLYESVAKRLEDAEDLLSVASEPAASPRPSHMKAFRFRRHRRTVEEESQREAAADALEAKRFLQGKEEEVAKLRKRASLFKGAQQMMHGTEDWILSQTLFGITTYYRREDDGSLSIKMEGRMEGVPLFDQMAVLREVDLHSRWAPFCSSSLTVDHLSKLDTLGWFCLGATQFGLARDGCFRAMGCDNLSADGTVLIAGQGVEDRPEGVPYDIPFLTEGLEGQDIPDPPTRLGSGRMTIKIFSAMVEILSPTSAHTKIVANVNPNLAIIPQGLMDLIMRKLCGVVLYKLQNTAAKIQRDPKRNVHARKMREESAFYQDWLKPKFESYCELRGWAMPPISAFECELGVSEELLEQQNRTLVTVIDDEDGSANSDVTMDADSVASKNPLVNYLREIEARTEMKKRAKINAAYRRVQEQLKPKNFSEEQNVRLKELKMKKARRRRGSTWSPELASVPVAASSSQPDESEHPKWLPRTMTNLHKHGWASQIIVTWALAAALLITLNADLIFGFSATMASNDHGWIATIFLDMVTFLHLVLSAIMHFAFCDVAIVYCVDSLDLGMKSGKMSKKHYSENIRLFVGLLSATLVTMSFLNASFLFVTRVGLWYLICAFRYLKGVFAPSFRLMEDYGVVAVAWRFPFKIVGEVLLATEYFLEMMLRLLKTMFIETNLMGDVNGFLVALLGTASTSSAKSLVQKVSTSAGDFLAHVLAVYEGDEEVVSWRANAIATTRFTLTYTAVFLFTLLMLFSTSSKKDKEATEASFSELVTPPESREPSVNSLAPINETAQLKITTFQDSQSEGAPAQPRSEPVSESSRKRRFGRFKRRKAGAASA